MFVMSFPPLAMAECGFRGEFGFIPTTYGTKTRFGKLERENGGMEHTRHRVITEKVVNLTSCELLNLQMSVVTFVGRRGGSPDICSSYLWPQLQHISSTTWRR